MYFYNPNIYPQSEYKIRLNELILYCEKEKIKLIVEKNSTQEFDNAIKGLENCPEKGERCLECFKLRLDRTACLAKELNMADFTTTLSVSPHKVSKNIFEAGDFVAKKHGLNFLHYDFKKNEGFKISQQIARENKMYKQTYCGCKYSIISKEVELRG